MTTGTTPFHYVDRQPPDQLQIEPNNHYYQVRLHDAQAVFKAGFWKQPGCLLLISEVTGSFHPDKTIQSMHQLRMIERNTMCSMGRSVNLTDWFPARMNDSVTVALKYVVIQDSPIKNLLTHLQKAGLDAALPVVEPNWKLALKVSSIVGQLLSCLLHEGEPQPLLDTLHQFNVNGLRTGYYAAVGSQSNEEYPSSLRINAQKKLTDGKNFQPIADCSYAVLQIEAVTRLGEEVVRQEPWWEILQATKQEILDTCTLYAPLESTTRQELIKKWEDVLRQVRKLTRQDRGYLLKEVDGIVQEAFKQVQSKLQPPKTLQSFSEDELPESLQTLLGTQSTTELEQVVEDYRYELEWSRQRLE